MVTRGQASRVMPHKRGAINQSNVRQELVFTLCCHSSTYWVPLSIIFLLCQESVSDCLFLTGNILYIQVCQASVSKVISKVTLQPAPTKLYIVLQYQAYQCNIIHCYTVRQSRLQCIQTQNRHKCTSSGRFGMS